MAEDNKYDQESIASAIFAFSVIITDIIIKLPKN